MSLNGSSLLPKSYSHISQVDMVTVAKYVMGLLALLVMSNASPLQGQQNLAKNTITGFKEDRDFVENVPLPEDKGQPLWASALALGLGWIGTWMDWTNQLARGKTI